MAKRYTINDGVIDITSLQDGQVAEVVKWSGDTSKIGTIIQRFDTTIIIIGKGSGYSYPNLLSTDNPEDYLVRVLNEGDLIQL